MRFMQVCCIHPNSDICTDLQLRSKEKALELGIN